MNLSLRRGDGQVLLERTEELPLLRRGLVSAMPKLGRCIDPLEVDLLKGFTRRVDKHALTQCDDALLDSRYGALE